MDYRQEGGDVARLAMCYRYGMTPRYTTNAETWLGHPPRQDVRMAQIGIEEMGLLMWEYTAKIQGLDEESYDGDVLIRRMVNTVRKRAAALARLKGRDYVMSANLDKVWEMVIPKLEMVRWMCGPDAQLPPLGTRE